MLLNDLVGIPQHRLEYSQAYALLSYGAKLALAGEYKRPGPVQRQFFVSVWEQASWTKIAEWPESQTTEVRTLGVYKNRLVVASSNRLSQFNGSTLVPLPGTFDREINALVEHAGALYVGGGFTEAGGVSAHGVALWDGSSWTSLGAGLDTPVRDLAVSGIGVVAANDEGVFHWDGKSWRSLGLEPDGGVWALETYRGLLIAAGAFANAGTASIGYIASWDGERWSSLSSGVASTRLCPGVFRLAVHRERLIAAGCFEQAGGKPALNIAEWDGSSWRALGKGLDGDVFAAASYNGCLVACGTFGTAGDDSVDGLACYIELSD